MSENDIKKILIIRLSALGDTIHTLPLAFSLRKKFPSSQIDWVVEDKAEKFVVNNPLLNNVYVIKKKQISVKERIKNFIQIIKKIRKENYDVVIDVQQLLKSGIILGLSKGKRKITLSEGREFSGFFANEIIKSSHRHFDPDYHVVKRNLEPGKYLGCDDKEIKFIIPDLEEEVSEEIKQIISNIDKTKKTIVIAPATTWKNKHWTVSGWCDVINEFKDECNIILTASQNEKSLIGEIISNIKGDNLIDLSGKTSLSDLVYIFKNVDLVISPDSGSAHIAWTAGGCKVVTLFFATSALRTAPFGDKYFSVSSKSPCSPCMKKHCRLKTSENKCIQDLNSQNVIDLLKRVL